MNKQVLHGLLVFLSSTSGREKAFPELYIID